MIERMILIFTVMIWLRELNSPFVSVRAARQAPLLMAALSSRWMDAMGTGTFTVPGLP